ncbi:hypothetical protein GCM10027567_17760 [Spongiibacter taiwanensis]
MFQQGHDGVLKPDGKLGPPGAGDIIRTPTRVAAKILCTFAGTPRGLFNTQFFVVLLAHVPELFQQCPGRIDIA